VAEREGSGQRTEKPTPKRRREARRKGQIPRSADLVGWLALLIASYVVPTVLRLLRAEFADYFVGVLEAVSAGQPDLALQRPEGLIRGVALVFVPFLCVLALVTAAGLAIQGGVTLTSEPLRPKLERISPKAGLKRLISAQSAVDTGKAVFRLIVLTVLVVQIMMGQIGGHLTGSPRPAADSGLEFAEALLLLVRLAAVVGLVVGAGDYVFQRWKVGKQLRMSKEEVRREARNTEGDPFIRSRRRALHQRVSQNKMLAAVGDASVVVVNPTHVAVALAYQAGGVPKVVAKGGDALALRIRERAFEAGVPVVEARPLARILHDLIDVGAEVPAHLFEAVAIVIAFVMRTPASALTGSIRRVNVPRSKLGPLPEEGVEAVHETSTAGGASRRRTRRPRARRPVSTG
jgi:flagellar biosynthetic protein FlhB